MMLRKVLALMVLLMPSAALAQSGCGGQFPANNYCGTGPAGLPKPTALSSVPLVVGTTPITGGTTKGLLYNNAGILGNLTTLNSGVLVTDSSGGAAISQTLLIVTGKHRDWETGTAFETV